MPGRHRSSTAAWLGRPAVRRRATRGARGGTRTPRPRAPLPRSSRRPRPPTRPVGSGGRLAPRPAPRAPQRTDPSGGFWERNGGGAAAHKTVFLLRTELFCAGGVTRLRSPQGRRGGGRRGRAAGRADGKGRRERGGVAATQGARRGGVAPARRRDQRLGARGASPRRARRSNTTLKHDAQTDAREIDTFNDKQSQIAERKTGDAQTRRRRLAGGRGQLYAARG